MIYFFTDNFLVGSIFGGLWVLFVLLTVIRILARCVYPPIKLAEILWPPKKRQES